MFHSFIDILLKKSPDRIAEEYRSAFQQWVLTPDGDSDLKLLEINPKSKEIKLNYRGSENFSLVFPDIDPIKSSETILDIPMSTASTPRTQNNNKLQKQFELKDEMNSDWILELNDYFSKNRLSFEEILQEIVWAQSHKQINSTENNPKDENSIVPLVIENMMIEPQDSSYSIRLKELENAVTQANERLVLINNRSFVRIDWGLNSVLIVIDISGIITNNIADLLKLKSGLIGIRIDMPDLLYDKSIPKSTVTQIETSSDFGTLFHLQHIVNWYFESRENSNSNNQENNQNEENIKSDEKIVNIPVLKKDSESSQEKPQEKLDENNTIIHPENNAIIPESISLLPENITTIPESNSSEKIPEINHNHNTNNNANSNELPKEIKPLKIPEKDPEKKKKPKSKKSAKNNNNTESTEKKSSSTSSTDLLIPYEVVDPPLKIHPPKKTKKTSQKLQKKNLRAKTPKKVLTFPDMKDVVLEDSISYLCELGFNRIESVCALIDARGDLQKAAEMLTSSSEKNETGNIYTTVEFKNNLEKLQQVIFGETESVCALKLAGNDYSMAYQLLTENSLPRCNLFLGLVAFLIDRLTNYTNYCVVCHKRHVCCANTPIVCCEDTCIFTHESLVSIGRIERCSICPFEKCTNESRLKTEQLIQSLYIKQPPKTISRSTVFQMYSHKFLPRDDIVRFINSTIGFDSIYIQNIIRPHLLARFLRKWDEIKKKYDNDPTFCTPKLGYHGTNEKNLASITEMGLLVPGKKGLDGKRVKHQTDAGWYGRGIYLSPNAGTSMSYCGGGRKLLVCSVLLGKFYEFGYTRANLLGEGGGLRWGYDSHTAENFNEFVIFDSAQILPCYAVAMN